MLLRSSALGLLGALLLVTVLFAVPGVAEELVSLYATDAAAAIRSVAQLVAVLWAGLAYFAYAAPAFTFPERRGVPDIGSQP